MTKPEPVSQHYGIGGVLDRIMAALAASGADSDALTIDDLAPVDEFHCRGRAATAELAEWADLGPDLRVLDVGSGLGGTSRYLADRFGCEVVGVDLTPEYCQLAEELSRRVGLGALTRFQHGSALELPFPDGSFDRAWTAHVQMNIADKAGFYREIARVLAPGGKLAFHDIFAGDGGEILFPVPWAADPSISHLASPSEARDLLEAAGLAAERWEDRTEITTEFFRAGRRQAAEGKTPALGLHLLLGDDAQEKMANLLANLEDGKLRVIQAVMG